MLSGVSACLDPATAPPPLRAAAGHVVGFITATEPLPMTGEELLADIRSVTNTIMAVVPGKRLLEWQLEGELEEEEAADESEAADEQAAAAGWRWSGGGSSSGDDGAAAAAPGRRGGSRGAAGRRRGSSGGGSAAEAEDAGDGDEGEAPSIQWAGGPEVFGALRRRIETHKRVRAEHIAAEADAVSVRGVGGRGCLVWRKEGGENRHEQAVTFGPVPPLLNLFHFDVTAQRKRRSTLPLPRSTTCCGPSTRRCLPSGTGRSPS
jgi:hypothetical protein